MLFLVKPKVSVGLEFVDIKLFEEGLLVGLIEIVKEPPKWPIWLSKLNGRHPSALDEVIKTKRKKTTNKRVDERFKSIEELLQHESEIINSENPFREIDQYARNQKPQLNQNNTRVFIFTYLCFGRDKWALTPAFINCGTGDRDESKKRAKVGRPSHKGKYSGYNATKELRERYLSAYKKRKKNAKVLTSLYEDIMRIDIGCKQRKTEKETQEWYHPKGEPFLSFNQFRYAIDKAIGREQRHLDLYGEVRVRTKKKPSEGQFSENIANLLERVEFDGEYLQEVPKGMIEGQPMPPLCVVRAVDTLTGMTCGIGFSLGDENKEAYQMALFSMAIPKTEYCKLFGIEIDDEDWPGLGLPSWAVFDRGPAGNGNLIEEFKEGIPGVRLTPSYQGQSKPIVETSHSKNLKLEGKPTFLESDKNYIDLARREILGAIAQNKKKIVENRMMPSMYKDVVPIPIELWKYYEKRMRTSAIPMSFDSVIRNLSHQVEFIAQEDGLYLDKTRYTSPELKDTGLLSKVIGSGRFKVKGYMPALVTRKAWIEYEGQLIEVHAVLSIVTDESEYDLTLYELGEIAQIRKANRTYLEENKTAISAKAKDDYRKLTGKEWDSGTRKSGRPKRKTVSAMQEFDVTNKAIGKRI